MLTTQAVADRYYQLAMIGQLREIQDELYSPKAVSIEPENKSDLPSRVEGLAAMREKEQQFYQQYEAIHGGTCGIPIVADNFFACAQSIDVTIAGERMVKHQLSVFEVSNGKIVTEQFFYHE